MGGRIARRRLEMGRAIEEDVVAGSNVQGGGPTSSVRAG